MCDGGGDTTAIWPMPIDAIQWRSVLSKSHREDHHSQIEHT